MKNQIYYVMGGLNQHDIEYVIEVPSDEDVVIMKYSDSTSWAEHVRNTKVLEALNSGDGYKINWTNKPGKVLDYAQIAELTILLNFLDKYDGKPLDYTFLKAAE